MHRVTSPCLKRRLGLTNASRWTRQVQLEAGTLAAFLGLDTNEESSFASKKKRGTLSERLRNSQEALTRQESKVTSLIDTLKTVAADSRPISEQSSNSSQYLSKRAKRKKRKADAPPAEQPSDFSQPTSSPSSPYDETATIKGERWKDDWGTDRLAPRQPDQPDDSEQQSSEPRPPESSPIRYKRRIEGLLEDGSEENILTDLEPLSEHHPVATLSHGLDRVLFNPGVHWLQDPRSHVYNFTPWLEKIPDVNSFAFERLAGFVPSSHDDDLWKLAKQEGRTFVGSTSSLTGIMSHIYFLISGDKSVDTSPLSQAFASEPRSFTSGQRMPTSVVFRHKDGVYSIDSDKGSDVADRNILTWMGTLLEKFLTASPQEFKQLLRSNPPAPDHSIKREAYRFAKSERFVMRSQLDCHDSRLPGTGVFDIKTRAALPIRLDRFNYEENSGYLIRSLHGPLESFEKEYYDLIRSAFLKYSFQARIGNMDGVIVAYHNTARLFGFQYIPLEEMDERLYGEAEAGPRVFRKCLSLLELISDEVIKTYPGQSLKCTFETLSGTGEMNIWVQPLAEDTTGEGEATTEGASKSAGPIKQLTVTASNYVSSVPTKGPAAVNAPSDADWSIYWTISTLSKDEESIHRAYEKSQDRQFRELLLPTGVAFKNAEEFWESVNFRRRTVEDADSEAGKEDAETSASLPTFRKAGKHIKILRSMARAGKEHTDMMEEKRKGMPRIVWGEEAPWVDPEETESAACLGTQDAAEVDVPGVDVTTPSQEQEQESAVQFEADTAMPEEEPLSTTAEESHQVEDVAVRLDAGDAPEATSDSKATESGTSTPDTQTPPSGN
ncbi:hypothetical protein ONZ45_g3987 [Pleurotus djamor]|nr:hypothetical protein ONZ45_g3987 [Pleurotus djamor]